MSSSYCDVSGIKHMGQRNAEREQNMSAFIDGSLYLHRIFILYLLPV